MRSALRLLCGLLLAAHGAACGDDGGSALPDAGAGVDSGDRVDAAADGGSPTWRWESVEPPAEGPVGLWGYTTAATDDTHALLFGGTTLDAFGRGRVLNEVWSWDASGAAPTFTALSPTGTAPAPRFCGCIAYDPLRNRVLVVGGRDSTFAALADTWELDLGANTWSMIDTSATGAPPGGVGCALAYSPDVDAFLLFGGASEAGVNDQTWRYAPAARAWSQLSVTGPSARYDAVLRHVADGAPLVLFAGANTAMAGPGFHDDVWLFHPEPPLWEEVVVAGERPPGRREAWTVIDADGRGFLAGFGVAGLQPTESLGDLWHFDLDARAWSVIDAGPGPGPRGFAPALPAGSSGVGVLLGGFDNDAPQPEIWRLVRTDG